MLMVLGGVYPLTTMGENLCQPNIIFVLVYFLNFFLHTPPGGFLIPIF